jgi:hypothetical protein
LVGYRAPRRHPVEQHVMARICLPRSASIGSDGPGKSVTGAIACSTVAAASTTALDDPAPSAAPPPAPSSSASARTAASIPAVARG